MPIAGQLDPLEITMQVRPETRAALIKLQVAAKQIATEAGCQPDQLWETSLVAALCNSLAIPLEIKTPPNEE